MNSSTDSIPEPISKSRFKPEQLSAKAHKALAALDGWAEPGVGIPVKDISRVSNLSVRDLGRILTRLSKAGRICRIKGNDSKSGCFRYWINAKQRKIFYLHATGAVQLPRPAQTVGDAEIDAEMSKKQRLLTSLNDINEKKRQLQEEAIEITAEIAKAKSDVIALTANNKSLKYQLKRITASVEVLRNEELKLAESKRQETAKVVSINERLERLSGTADLSKRLFFIRKLRERPALTDLNELRLIEKDYFTALRNATQE